MKGIISTLAGIVMYANCAHAVPATVNYIIDGDTFSAYVNLATDIQISVRVRLINADTPELNGQCASEIARAQLAQARLAEIIPVGTTVELTNIKDDKYLGRIDAHVITPGGHDVGEILIRENLARRYGGGKRAGWCE